MSKQQEKSQLPIVGWREWIKLPELGVNRIKAKIDTGARSSCLHAFDMEEFEEDGKQFVRFNIHPIQRNSKIEIGAVAPVLEYREIRSSSGHVDRRPVILTKMKLMGKSWPIELTLANRDQMGFRMLVGREAVRGRFLVDPNSSYLGGRPKKKPNSLG